MFQTNMEKEKFKNLGVQLSDLSSLNKDDVLQCAQKIRILISDALHPIPVTDIFNSDILEIFPDLLKRDDQPQLQHELVWVLINIFAEDADKIVGVVKYGVIEPLVKLLTSNNDKVRFQSLWALSNIVCDALIVDAFSR
ncbi:MAG: hypothetical protein EZS28_015933 [Streblomastix strix]|uniref:Uncharacterized protein n=1 Tax=Streblomastix strix TaxID=222440 RepID=A0A5J4W128_9EUKA|nr:MAG: hypothetical protein EZS28_015933 [Streblomastix strix]